jgi:hypothetical protein
MVLRAVVEYAALTGAQDEVIIKEMDVDGNRLIKIYLFRCRYEMILNIRENTVWNKIHLFAMDGTFRKLTYQTSYANQ